MTILVLGPVGQLQKLLGIDSLPLPIEKPIEIQTYEYAQ